jgi:hypothetical protein
MKKRVRIPKVMMLVAAAVAALGLLLLMVSLGGVYTQAAPLEGQGTGIDPCIETCTVTADLAISDTRPSDGVAKTVYFNNSSSGFITATFGISGTPPLGLLAYEAFDKPTHLYTSSLAQASFVVTYAVATTHTTPVDVTYMAINAALHSESIVISYVSDVVAPVVTVTAPAESSVTTFTVSWEATDPSPGSGVVASYTVAYREDDGAWDSWLSSTALTGSTFFSATLDHTYTFSVTVYDHVGNRGEGAAVTQVGRHYVYLPLVMSDWVWWYQFDIYEPNDSPNEAYGPLTSTQVYTAYIWDATDTGDYYYFTPSTDNDVTVDLTNIPVLAGADYDLYVYDQSIGTWVALSIGIGTETESVTFKPEAGKKYHILVDPAVGFSSSQPYRLTVIYQ